MLTIKILEHTFGGKAFDTGDSEFLLISNDWIIEHNIADPTPWKVVDVQAEEMIRFDAGCQVAGYLDRCGVSRLE